MRFKEFGTSAGFTVESSNFKEARFFQGIQRNIANSILQNREKEEQEDRDRLNFYRKQYGLDPIEGPRKYGDYIPHYTKEFTKDLKDALAHDESIVSQYTTTEEWEKWIINAISVFFPRTVLLDPRNSKSKITFYDAYLKDKFAPLVSSFVKKAVSKENLESDINEIGKKIAEISVNELKKMIKDREAKQQQYWAGSMRTTDIKRPESSKFDSPPPPVEPDDEEPKSTPSPTSEPITLGGEKWTKGPKGWVNARGKAATPNDANLLDRASAASKKSTSGKLDESLINTLNRLTAKQKSQLLAELKNI